MASRMGNWERGEMEEARTKQVTEKGWRDALTISARHAARVHGPFRVICPSSYVVL
jgi:hypothetical protein